MDHCFWPSVIVAVPPSPRFSSRFLIRLNVSTITPTKRFIEKKQPTNIHTIENMAALE